MTSIESDAAIAIVGMAGRFPGARNIEELWQLLLNGQDARAVLTDDELREAGVPESLIRDPSYVKSCMRLDGPELFDAEFFGYSPRQATTIDPQQRLFIECAWEALESAGYGNVVAAPSVGVFAGCGFNGYLLNVLSSGEIDPADGPQYVIDADKDYLTTRVAYKLGLTGPCVTVQTACSTSLVAVHIACRSLLDFECDLALAGGVSVRIPQETGYLHVAGGTTSPDGRCRAFDADANGVTPGSGVAIVALRRLSDAVRDGDQVYAVIRSTAVNNDGSRKVGYSAPGLPAQEQLLATALALADLQPRDIGLIESHGTGTPLGDSIELEALDQVYRAPGSERFCALGSIKTNIGHLDTAAGVTGLIKAALCLKHRMLVPSLNFSKPNPILERAGCPFFVNTQTRSWEASPGTRRRAGVSSFGIGGTNAHAILEEAPLVASERNADHGVQLIPVSARDPAALARAGQRLAEFLQANEGVSLGDVACTLQSGRRRFKCRRVIAASSTAELVATLLAGQQDDYVNSERSERPIAFMFPGQGSQQAGMAAGLYRTDEHFRETLDHCASLVQRALGFDVREFLCATDAGESSSLRDPLLVQPAIFVVEYCLAHRLMRWGLKPSALIGHSFGEYAAACVAGVFSLEAATQLVAARARLVGQLPAGAMLAVSLSESEARGMLDGGMCIAAINAADQCVVSGGVEEVERLGRVLRSRNIEHRPLRNTRAFHSAMMQPAASGLREAASGLARKAAEIPLISCVTGTWATSAQITSPNYWSDHLLLPVKFAAGVAQVARNPGTIFIEVGPGTALTSLARHNVGRDKDFAFLPCLGNAAAVTSADLLRNVVGGAWAHGGEIDWQQLHAGRAPRRIALPAYPFNRRRFSLPRSAPAAPKPAASQVTARLPPEQWFYLPSWRRSIPLDLDTQHRATDGDWLVLVDDMRVGSAMADRLKARGERVTCVGIGQSYAELADGSFRIDPAAPDQYQRLVERLRDAGRSVQWVVHCWSLTCGPEGLFPRAGSLELGYSSLLFLMQALARDSQSSKTSVLVVTNELQNISGIERVDPEKATLAALCKIVAQELEGTRCTVVDLPPPRQELTLSQQYERYVGWLLTEIIRAGTDPVLAYRGSTRFVQTYEQMDLTSSDKRAPALREQGLYVITGGLGRIGLAVAMRLARSHRAKLLLLTREPFPEPSTWDDVLASSAASTDLTVSRIGRIREMQALGAEVSVEAVELADVSLVKQALALAEQRFGPIRGVFHLAGDLRHRSINRPIMELEEEDLQAQLRPKVTAQRSLFAALSGRVLDFGVAFSSNAATFGGIGFGAYAAANAVLDSMAGTQGAGGGCPWLVVNWDGWITDGQVPCDPYTLTAEEGLDALWRLLALGVSAQVVVSASPVQTRLVTWVRQLHAGRSVAAEHASSDAGDVRDGSRVQPRTELERTIAAVWSEVLGDAPMGVEDNFLELGGDSLIGLRIVSRIRDRFGVNVPLVSLMGEHATIAGMAIEIVTRLAELHDAAVVDEKLDTIRSDAA